MIRFARRLAAVFVLTFAASASTIHSPDYTDMWWNAQESGWGINVIQQGNVIFATWFVYAPDGTPRWYVASGMLAQSAPSGHLFSGELYQTTGPWFGGPFTPAPTNQSVGTATLSFSSVSTATLTYNVGTTNVSKNITRYAFQNTSPAGTYFPAGLSLVGSSCTGSGQNGALYEVGGLTVTLSGSTVTMLLSITQSARCTFSGTLSPNGRFASVNGGTWSCADGNTTTNTGNFSISMLDVQVQHLTGIFNGSDQFCQLTGRIGGLRAVN